MDSERLTLVIAGALAAVLQLLLAPVMTIGPAVPSFIVVAVLVVSILSPDEPHYLFAFIMGLVADLMGSSPVGGTSIALLACSWALPLLVETVGNDNLLMSALILLLGALGIQLVCCVFLSIAGLIGFVDALGLVALPCAVYDGLLAFIVYLVATRMASGRSPRGGATMSNVRFS